MAHRKKEGERERGRECGKESEIVEKVLYQLRRPMGNVDAIFNDAELGRLCCCCCCVGLQHAANAFFACLTCTHTHTLTHTAQT